MSRKNEKEQLIRDMGYRIRKTRETLGFKQKHFADRLGVSNTHICDIENGNAGCGSYILFLISKKFKSNPLYLLHGTGQMFYDSAAQQVNPGPSSAPTPVPQPEAAPEPVDSRQVEEDLGEDGSRIRELLSFFKRSPVVKFAVLGFFSKFLIENKAVIAEDIESRE